MRIFSGTNFLLGVVILLVVFLRVGAAFGYRSGSGKSNKIEILISPKGNNNNQGTADAPLKSLEKAKQLARFILKSSSYPFSADRSKE